MTKKEAVPQVRFKGFGGEWGHYSIGDIFIATRGKVLAATKTSESKNGEMKYPVYSSQTKNNGLMGYYSEWLFDTAITWTTDGANAGTVNFREGKFYSTNVNGVLLSDAGYANKSVAEILNKVAWKFVSKVGNPKLMNNVMSDIVIVLPATIKEQTRISEFFRNLDSLITLQQRKYEKLQNIKRAILEKMFPKPSATAPEVRFKRFRGEWEEKPLRDAVDVQNGRDYSHLPMGSIPVYGTGGYMLSITEALSYNDDAVGIGRKGTINKPYILKAPFWTVDTLFYAVPRKNFDLQFVYCVFQRIDWKQKDESTGVPSLSKTTINCVSVLYPDKTEQTRIGEFFRNLDALITLQQRKCEKLQNIKKAMLGKMFV